MFRRRLTVQGSSTHFTRYGIVRFDDARPDTTQGVVLSHSELCRSGVAMVAAIRDCDTF